MATFARIFVDFDTLAANYFKYDSLPPALTRYMKGLNDPIIAKNKKALEDATEQGLPPPLPQKLNTSCVIQVSHAFNATAHKIPPSSFWRANPLISGGNGYYLQAVNELERYLAIRYGSTADIKGDRSQLADTQGILIFGAAHTEFWNKNNIIQKAGGAGGMDEAYIWAQKRILFWQITGRVGGLLVPEWLPGWWTVYDGNYYYYYFSDQSVVTYTKTKPASPIVVPAKIPLNEGKVTMTEHGLIIDWNPADGGATKETFTQVAWTSESEMNGVSNRYSPLFAKKMT